MKYFLIFGLLFSSLFAHGGGEHIHIFSSWHVVDFILLIVGLIAGFSIFKFFFKETN